MKKRERGDGKKKGGGKREGGQERSPSQWDVGSGRNPDDPTGNGGNVCIVLPHQFSERPDAPGRDNLTCPVDGLKPLSLRSPLALKMEPGLPEALPVPGRPSLRLLP